MDTLESPTRFRPTKGVIHLLWVAGVLCLLSYPRPVEGAVAASGDTALAGCAERAVVEVLVKDGAAWKRGEPIQYPGEKDAGDRPYFGYSVTLDADVAAVGAPSPHGSGAVYIYRRRDGEYHLEQHIDGSKLPGHQHWFGAAISISGNTLVVGNCEQHVPDQEDTSAYVYVREGKKWRFQQELKNPKARPHDNFGFAVDIDGDVAVVSAREQIISAGPRTVGAVYLFRREGDEWHLEDFLHEPGTFRFGGSVAIDGEHLAVATSESAGVAHTYRYQSSSWIRQGALENPSRRDRHTTFGLLDLSGDTFVVAAQSAGSANIFIREKGEHRKWRPHFTVREDPCTSGQEYSTATNGDTAFLFYPHLDSARGSIVRILTRVGAGWIEQKPLFLLE